MKALLCGLSLVALAVGSGCESRGSGPQDAGNNVTDGGLQDAGTGLADTANSIGVVTGAGRTDPEGTAPASPSTSRVTWRDARGAERTATLYGYLYQYDFSFVGGNADTTQVTQVTANDNADGHPGFGYVVSHNTETGNSPLGKANAPTSVQTKVFSGGHHAIHHIELIYARDHESGGNGIQIPVVIEWFVATGRDHPVWSVTWKEGSAVNPSSVDFNAYRMDTRGPYGSLNWDGASSPASGDTIGGVAWGDFGLQFTTTDSELTLNSHWTYDTANTINFVHAWTQTTNAEMGIVQTRPGDKELGYPDRVYGRERGSTSALAYTGKGDCSGLGDARKYSMPCVDGWAYQMMNFDWDPGSGKPVTEATSTKLMAWGSSYGWLGATDDNLFDFSATVDARGDRSYATFVVMGPKCRYAGGGSCSLSGDVADVLDDVDALTSASLTPSVGSLAAAAPKGPGASETKALTNGYDDTYAVFTLNAVSNQVAFTFTPAPGKPVRSPIFRIHGYTAGQLPTVSVGGSSVSVNSGATNSGAFVSLDTTTNDLWVTLNQTLASAADVRVGQ